MNTVRVLVLRSLGSTHTKPVWSTTNMRVSPSPGAVRMSTGLPQAPRLGNAVSEATVACATPASASRSATAATAALAALMIASE